ncbi:MAG: 30S ribosomal protein S16 [Bacteroidota bacterium]
MPVKLRLRRQGRKKAPHYAIVAADSRAPRDGRFIEKIGFYNPIKDPAHVYVDHELALKWLKVGAQPTHTVRSLLRHAGVTLKFALIKQGKSEEEMDRIFNRWWEEKKSKKKKKVIQVTVHGLPLEEVPDAAMKQHSGAANKAPEVVETPVEEAAPAEAVEPVAEDAPEAEVAATEEVAEATPEAEQVTEPVEEAPAAEEKPAEEVQAEETPAEAEKEEVPTAE